LKSESDAESPLDESDVIITEFDEWAWELATALERSGIPYRGHDRDPQRLAAAMSRGFNVFLANLDRPRTLSRAVAGKARAVVSLLEDDEISDKLIINLQKHAPSTPVFAATRDYARFERLLNMNLNGVYLKNENTSKLLLRDLLRILKPDASDELMETITVASYTRGADERKLSVGARSAAEVPNQMGTAP
jgi:Trk K+ transport system NAD-binding subunit